MEDLGAQVFFAVALYARAKGSEKGQIFPVGIFLLIILRPVDSGAGVSEWSVGGNQ